ncbi:class I SAM-dependent methyltransferase [Sporosarcina cyprini]|uniref:class I SAM-dependent methyltransferase n=1 Tax=Sporosarcina cyprini TaxID=2910523 RepID=UPI001EDFCC09|nr:class I SAM-dependent methyltransferase [Sporosarcina cyprini]MCG3087235.1 class I SAM-dependent methyltransferase [Sporosarcina cyprini]
MEVDFGKVAKSYAQSRNDLPAELIPGLHARGVDFSQKRIADLGSGTGVLTRLLHDQGANVIGIEPSSELIAEAQRIDAEKGNEIEYDNRFSEATGLPDSSYDMAVALRAWHWFDREASLREIKRILKPHGQLLVMDSGFMSIDPIVAESMGILKDHVPPGLMKPAGSKAEASQFINSFPIEWFEEWKQHGFDLLDTYNFEYTVSFTAAEWGERLRSLSWFVNLKEEERLSLTEKVSSALSAVHGTQPFTIRHRFYIAILQN